MVHAPEIKEHHTPVYFEVSGYLDEQFVRIDREKITHWLMRLSSGNQLDIDDCRGRRITLGGVRFEGSARDVYWSFIDPCLKDIISEAFRRTKEVGSALPPYALHRALDETGELTKKFVARVYRQMHKIDRRLCKMEQGKPLPAFDSAPLVACLCNEIDARIASLKAYSPIGFRRLIVEIRKDPKFAFSALGIGSLLSAGILELCRLLYRGLLG